MPQVIVKQPLQKKPYRLKCRFQIEARPSQSRLDLAKTRMAERFVHDMHAQGWEHDSRYPCVMKGPFPKIQPVTIHRPRVLTAREMLPLIVQGAKFRDEGGTQAQAMPKLEWSEYWEYEIAAIFVRDEIKIEAQPHEGIRRAS